ncbi:sigma-54-dependent Fis family transcriptional regulator [candidate division KSB1 bacterium]|nr:sigma-54-dependent Fis family transcriptional regulator [candidate division KSB1 bacterium]
MINLVNIRILLIEDEDYDVRRIRNTIEPFRGRISIKDVAATGQAAIDLLKKNAQSYDVIIMDYQIAGGLMGERLISKIKELDATLQIIVVTKMTINVSDYDFANRLLEAGAMWYCTKYPGDIDEYIYQPTDFILSIFNAAEKRRIELERVKSTHKLQQSVQDILSRNPIIGHSTSLKNLQQQIDQCAQNETNVLIRGASGTGKELVAKHIHYTSRRKFENFVPINCGSLPDNLIESELFGFEKGSFTGADTAKPGLFEIAHRGTAFLDEITELPLPAQAKLLRVIQEGEIDKIGRTGKKQVDVRIIAASNKILEQEVKDRRFREDLYYRLNVVFIHLPALKERREDIPLLVKHFLNHFSQDMSRETPKLDKGAMALLVQYDWPGNVRELQNVVQRMLLLDSPQLSAEQVQKAMGLSPASLSADEKGSLWDQDQIISWRDMEKKVRAQYFAFVRQHTVTDAEAARKLGLAPPNYHRMCRELGLK